MIFEVDVNGRTRRVSIERVSSAGVYRVTVDGRSHRMNVRRAGEFSLSLLIDRTAAPASREFLVVPDATSGDVLVTFDGRIVRAALNGRSGRRAAAEGGRHQEGEQHVVAPMPGRVMRVLVKPGDEVTARQGLIVIEAMKMENELRSPKPGRVKAVQVAAGASVEAGRVLIVVE